MHGYFSAEKFLVLGSTSSQVIFQRLIFFHNSDLVKSPTGLIRNY